jgi:hypothetical protein
MLVLMQYRRTPAASALFAEECHRTQHTHVHDASHQHAEPLPSSHHFAIAIPAHTGAASTAAVKLQRKRHAPMCE